MRDISVLILAAGQGTRMKSELPKVLHTISGKPMLYYILQAAKKLSNDVTVVLSHKKELIVEKMSPYLDGVKIVEQDVANFPGTGGALRGYSPANDLLILNGDMPLVEVAELERFTVIDADIVMSVISLDNPDGYGRVLIEDGQVQKIIEQKDASRSELQISNVNAGVYLVKKELIAKFIPKLSNDNASKEYYLTDIIQMAKECGKSIKPIFVKEENFKGVNTKKNLSDAEVIMQRRIKDRWMIEGVLMRLPETIYIEESVELIGEVSLENGVTLLGATKITESHIKTGSIIEDSIVEHSSVGPMARIRPKSHVKNSHIGNFVETKKATLDGVKAGHLSYLGDCNIGQGTNVGCGTITCNYDGKAKYQTTIGKNVFIGSDTQLVAPVTIADDVIIAAGSTVTKDANKGDLVIARAPLKFVKDFYYRFFGKSSAS
jgi:bifunctional UDP-N-acetylglucosamine pyrophosphorylase/glucosamine-1-phosphate N-acetyltransferase